MFNELTLKLLTWNSENVYIYIYLSWKNNCTKANNSNWNQNMALSCLNAAKKKFYIDSNGSLLSGYHGNSSVFAIID